MTTGWEPFFSFLEVAWPPTTVLAASLLTAWFTARAQKSSEDRQDARAEKSRVYELAKVQRAEVERTRERRSIYAGETLAILTKMAVDHEAQAEAGRAFAETKTVWTTHFFGLSRSVGASPDELYRERMRRLSNMIGSADEWCPPGEDENETVSKLLRLAVDLTTAEARSQPPEGDVILNYDWWKSEYPESH